MEQATWKKRRTRREAFLEKMDGLVPLRSSGGAGQAVLSEGPGAVGVPVGWR